MHDQFESTSDSDVVEDGFSSENENEARCPEEIWRQYPDCKACHKYWRPTSKCGRCGFHFCASHWRDHNPCYADEAQIEITREVILDNGVWLSGQQVLEALDEQAAAEEGEDTDVSTSEEDRNNRARYVAVARALEANAPATFEAVTRDLDEHVRMPLLDAAATTQLTDPTSTTYDTPGP